MVVYEFGGPTAPLGDMRLSMLDYVKIFDLVNISVTVYCKDILDWVGLGSTQPNIIIFGKNHHLGKNVQVFGWVVKN